MSLPVIGILLHLGSDARIRGTNKGQTAFDIATEKHRERVDLAYVLSVRPPTIPQLIRRVIATTPDLFDVYDGNRVVADRLLAAGNDVYVDRLSRGGMSSGMVSGSHWAESFIPLIERQAGWLQEMWHAVKTQTQGTR